MTSPAEIDTEKLSLAKFDFKTNEAEYEADPTKFLVVEQIRHDGRPLSISFKGDIVTQGINVGNFEGNSPHTIGIELSTEDADKIRELNMFLVKIPEADDEWTVKELAAGDKVYVKLKYGKNAYLFKHNMKKFDPKKPHDSPLKRNQEIEAIVDAVAYFNFKEKTMGISFPALELKSKEEKPKKNVTKKN